MRRLIDLSSGVFPRICRSLLRILSWCCIDVETERIATGELNQQHRGRTDGDRYNRTEEGEGQRVRLAQLEV